MSKEMWHCVLRANNVNTNLSVCDYNNNFNVGFFFFYLQTLVVQVKCFEEIINIGYAVYRIHGLPWFRSLSWYFLLTSNYFFYGESLVDYFGVVINRTVSDWTNNWSSLIIAWLLFLFLIIRTSWEAWSLTIASSLSVCTASVLFGLFWV